jgi:AraC-like DNA-binding protein
MDLGAVVFAGSDGRLMIRNEKTTGLDELRQTSGERRLLGRPAGTVPMGSVQRVVAATGNARATDLCRAVGLEPEALDDGAARVPMHKLVGIYEAAARLTGDPSFGLRVGSLVDLRSFGACGYIALNSASVGQALSRIARYFPLWTDGAGFRLETEGATARLSWEYLEGDLGETRQDCEMSLLAAARVGISPRCDWRPLEVHLRHSPPRRDSGDHQRFFRAPVHFHMPTNALILDRKALDAAIPGADHRLAELLSGLADQQLAERPESVAHRAGAALRAAMSDGRPSLPLLARRMGLGARSLQRRLAEEGASFRALLGAARREMAEAYLRDPRVPTAQIADRLGFADATEFQRAFRTWTGLTPGRYRRAASGERGQGSIPATVPRS